VLVGETSANEVQFFELLLLTSTLNPVSPSVAVSSFHEITMTEFVESFQSPLATGASTEVTGAEVASVVGSSDGIADAEAVGAGVASSLPLSGRVTTTTARRIIPTIIATSTLAEAPCLGADAGFEWLVEGLVGALVAATFGVDETSTREAPRDDEYGTGGITTEEADVAAFFAAAFFAADFLTVFFALVFLTADFLTADFLTVFFAVVFLTADFLTVFFATAFFAVDFFAVDFFAVDFFAVDFLATVFFAALFFTAAFLTAGFFFTATITPSFG